MTLNLQKNADSIQEAFDKVANSKTGDEWVIFEYEGVSNVVKVGDEGDGGIDEFSASFNSGKLQYGAISVRLSPNVLPKIVLVHWQGETVPVSRKATTTSHAQDVRRFLKTVHTILYARNEIDIEPDCIRKEVSKLPGTMAVEQMDSSFSAPTTVGSVYKPVKPHIDINLKERERFWEQMKEDEKQDKVVGEKLSVQEESYKPKNGTAKALEAYSSTSQPAVSAVAPPMVEKSKSEKVVQSVERMSLNEPVAPPPPPPPMGTQKPTGLCAVALWDYQAGDSSEISFDPDETISEIEQVDEGWWKGRGPNGDVGLFPANYVRLL